MSLGVVKRMVLVTFEVLSTDLKRSVREAIDKFDFVAAGFSFSQKGFRVHKYVNPNRACPVHALTPKPGTTSRFRVTISKS